MTARVARFKQVDLRRAYKAVTGAGMRVGRIEIDPNGKIVIFPEPGLPQSLANEWDEVLQ